MSQYRGRSHGRSSYRGNNRNRRPRRNYKKSQRQVIAREQYINFPTEISESIKKFQGASFDQFSLHQNLSNNLSQKGFSIATEIQTKAIPLIMQGKDVLGISETGSGKTGAFLIPSIHKLLSDRNQKLLVIAPTRELAMQIEKEAISFVKGSQLRVALTIGGESIGKQISQLRRDAQIIVGTPGRLLDLIERKVFNPHFYNNIVIDEVDQMLDMGFVDDIKKIMNRVSQKRQTLFFSATLNSKIEKIVQSISANYQIVKLTNNAPSKNVIQDVIDYSHTSERIPLLQELLQQKEVEKAIVFVETKRYADQIDKILYQNRFKVGAIHGDKRQNVRKRVIDKFKKSHINILVATNVAARGIDIHDITHVINLDEPQTHDEYIHRIGRTGRNGNTGKAFTFVKKSKK